MPHSKRSSHHTYIVHTEISLCAKQTLTCSRLPRYIVDFGCLSTVLFRWSPTALQVTPSTKPTTSRYEGIKKYHLLARTTRCGIHVSSHYRRPRLRSLNSQSNRWHYLPSERFKTNTQFSQRTRGWVWHGKTSWKNRTYFEPSAQCTQTRFGVGRAPYSG